MKKRKRVNIRESVSAEGMENSQDEEILKVGEHIDDGPNDKMDENNNRDDLELALELARIKKKKGKMEYFRKKS